MTQENLEKANGLTSHISELEDHLSSLNNSEIPNPQIKSQGIYYDIYIDRDEYCKRLKEHLSYLKEEFANL